MRNNKLNYIAMDRVRLHNLESIVTPILESVPETRDDDRRLYLEVLTGAGVDVSIPLGYYLGNSAKYPSYEGVARTRRKVQSKRPELRGTGIWKADLAEEYKAYALSDGNAVKR